MALRTTTDAPTAVGCAVLLLSIKAKVRLSPLGMNNDSGRSSLSLAPAWSTSTPPSVTAASCSGFIDRVDQDEGCQTDKTASADVGSAQLRVGIHVDLIFVKVLQRRGSIAGA